MKHFVLTRSYLRVGTFGEIDLPDSTKLLTVEDPDKDNGVGVSCIPEGRYLCKPRRYHKGGYDAYEVTAVPGRTNVLIHIANSDEDVQGCVGVGLEFPVWLEGRQLSIGRSKEGFAKFMAAAGGEEFTLEIRRYEPTPGVASKGTAVQLRAGESVTVMGV